MKYLCELEKTLIANLKENGNDVSKMAREDYLNALLMLVVNRANSYNREKYNCIVVKHIEDTKRFQLFYNCVKIMSIYTQISVYFHKYQVDKLTWFDKSIAGLKAVDAKKISKKENKGLSFSILLDDEAAELGDCAQAIEQDGELFRIFKGLSNEIIEEIVDTFFSLKKKEGN